MSKRANFDFLATFLLLITPVLGPYVALGFIPVNYFIFTIYFVIYVAWNREVYVKKIIYPLIILIAVHTVINIISVLARGEYTGVNAIISVISAGIVFSILFSISADVKYFTYLIHGMAIVCTIGLFYQAISLQLGLLSWGGKISWLTLAHYSGFMEDNWGFRFNSFFQEPSYYALFMIPVFYMALKSANYILSGLYISGLILSSSSLGVAGAILAIFYNIFSGENFIKKTFIAVVFFLIVVFLLSITFDNVLFYRTFDKLMSIEEESSSRVFGQFYLYFNLSFFEQIFGVGFGQLKSTFYGKISGVTNYSNSIVIALICYGIIGLIAYIIFIAYMIKVSRDKFYVAIFCLIALTDYFLYNYFFFYYLYIIFFMSNSNLHQKD